MPQEQQPEIEREQLSISLTAIRVSTPERCPHVRCRADLDRAPCAHFKAILPDLHGLTNTSTVRTLAALWHVNERRQEIYVRGPLGSVTDRWYVTVVPIHAPIH